MQINKNRKKLGSGTKKKLEIECLDFREWYDWKKKMGRKERWREGLHDEKRNCSFKNKNELNNKDDGEGNRRRKRTNENNVFEHLN